MYIITEAGTNKEVFINDNALVLIEEDSEAKGYYTVHTTIKRFTVKAESISDILDKSAERAAEIITNAMASHAKDKINAIINGLKRTEV